jgi:hypothetical protein
VRVRRVHAVGKLAQEAGELYAQGGGWMGQCVGETVARDLGLEVVMTVVSDTQQVRLQHEWCPQANFK